MEGRKNSSYQQIMDSLENGNIVIGCDRAFARQFFMSKKLNKYSVLPVMLYYASVFPLITSIIYSFCAFKYYGILWTLAISFVFAIYLGISSLGNARMKTINMLALFLILFIVGNWTILTINLKVFLFSLLAAFWLVRLSYVIVSVSFIHYVLSNEENYNTLKQYIVIKKISQ